MAQVIQIDFTKCCDHGISIEDGSKECRKCELANQQRELRIKLVYMIGSLSVLGLVLIWVVK